MADRRMFSKSIIDSDAFLDMPMSAQALYFHLSMRADDDGFVNSPRRIQRMVGASDDDCRLLVSKQFIIPFETGVVVIRHWRIHNYIQKDRYKETIYLAEKSELSQDASGAYTLDTDCIQDVSKLDTQLGKDSIGKDSIGKVNNKRSAQNKRFVPPTVDEVRAYCKERGNNIDAESFVDYYTSTGWLVGKKPMKDWKASVRTWERNERRQDNARPDTAATGNTKREWHLECAVDGTKDYNREPSTGQIDWPELS